MSLLCVNSPRIIPPGTNSTVMPSVVQVHFSLIISSFLPAKRKHSSCSSPARLGESAMKARLVLITFALLVSALIFPTNRSADQ